MQFYLNVQALGDPFGGGWMAWPQRTLDDYRVARNVYEAMRGYLKAEHHVNWTKANPDAWQIVGRVLALEMERRDQVEQVSSEGWYTVWLRWRYGLTGVSLGRQESAGVG